MNKKLMLIVNPFSGKGRAKNVICDLVTLFSRFGYIATVYVTGDMYNAEYFAKTFSNDFDLVVCLGGDGTLSDVTSGLMQTASPPPIGYIPMGTANDMARTLSLSRDITTAAKAIANGEPMSLDMGSFDNKFFTYVMAFGAFTEVSYATPQRIKRALGHLAYIFKGVASMPQALKPQHTILEYDDGVIEGDFVFGSVTNSTSVAGLVKLNPSDVDLGDGLFEVMLVKKPLKISEMRTIISNILSQKYTGDNVIFLHTKKAKFTFDKEVSWTRDGENGGHHQEITIENRRHALKIML
jgi:diacylglycerol kinase (ATP)